MFPRGNPRLDETVFPPDHVDMENGSLVAHPRIRFLDLHSIARHPIGSKLISPERGVARKWQGLGTDINGTYIT